MKKLTINKTLNSPEILMDADKGIIEIKGVSFLEDSVPFYIPVLHWVDEYTTNPKVTTVNVELTYFNSATAKILLTIFKSLKLIRKKDFKLTINWRYAEDDEDIRNSGFDFAKLADLEFNMIEK